MPTTAFSGFLEPARHGPLLQQNGFRLVGGLFVAQYIEYEQPIQLASGALVASRIGAYSYASLNVRIHHTTIGRYCSIADNVTTAPGDRPTDRLSTSPASFTGTFDWFRPAAFPLNDGTERGVTIGNDVWIGTDALIFGGVTIGDGAVIGARSVVTRDVEPYMIVAGVPARAVRMRFAGPVVEKLMKLAIWNFDLPSFFQATGIPIHSKLTEQVLNALERAIEDRCVHPMESVIRRLSPSAQQQWRVSVISTTKNAPD